jgi:hypothetical protein
MCEGIFEAIKELLALVSTASWRSSPVEIMDETDFRPSGRKPQTS